MDRKSSRRTKRRQSRVGRTPSPSSPRLQIADELTRSQQELIRERSRRADLRRRVRDKSRSIRALIDREVKA